MTESHQGFRSEIRSFPAFIALLAVIGVIAGLVPGCSGRSPGEGWVHETFTERSVTTVRTLSGSVWGGTARLVEEASIGAVDAAETTDEYLLGSVSGLAVGEDRIYILDRQVPTIRVYDFEGRYIRDIGREGSGPGEYRQPESIAVHPLDGRLFVRTPQNSRINVYSRDGEYLTQWPLRSGFYTSNPFVMTDEGELWTFIIANLGSADVTDWLGGMRLCGPEGTVSDTIHVPVFDFKPWDIVGRSENRTSVNRVPFSPDMAWAMAVDGSIVGGVSDSYSFEIRRPDGTTVMVERVCEPVRVLPEEGRWHRDAAAANMVNQFPGWAWNGRKVPGTKPAFARFLPDRSGRIWVLRQGPGRRVEGGVENPFDEEGWWSNPLWRDTLLVDVFDLDGRYLGEIELPEHVRFSPRPVIDGEMIVCYTEDEEGVPHVKRFRLVLPGDETMQ